MRVVGRWGRTAPASEGGRYKCDRGCVESGFGEFADGAAEEVE